MEDEVFRLQTFDLSEVNSMDGSWGYKYSTFLRSLKKHFRHLQIFNFAEIAKNEFSFCYCVQKEKILAEP